ncbi:MAG: M1 family metallopeptidase [Anaerolineae bacterium]|nr:M1 family metallopeptidase [Anaerolineae bacterium]
MMNRARMWSLLVMVFGGLVLAGCGGPLPEAPLPTLAPTATALPHATATFVPLPTPAPIPEVNWDDTTIFRQAMREGFEDDVALFANRNRYYIEATLEMGDVATLRGVERVRYTNRAAEALDEIVFRLYPNLDAFSAQMNILSVSVGGQPVTPAYYERRSVLRVPLPEPLAPGEQAELVIAFNSAIERGFAANYGEYSYQQGVFSAPEWYPVLSVYEEGEGWWTARARDQQGEQTYTETGLYEIFLTADEGLTLVMSGSTVAQVANDDGTVTHHVVSGPMRDSMLVASERLLQVTDKVDGITLNFYYWDDPEQLERNADAAAAGMAIIRETVQTFNETFGQYPFREFDIVQTNTRAGGIEYPGLIVIADRYWNAADDFYEVVLVHEAGHQWFYSLVGNNQLQLPFVDEGLTSFTEFVYFWETAETEREIQQANDYVRREQQTYNSYVGSGNPDLPLGLSTEAYVESQYSLIIYTKGPLFFNEITTLIGREQMYAFLQEYFRRYRYEVADITDILATLEDVTGQEWDGMFYEWVGPFKGLDPAAVATVDALRRSG